MMDVDSANATDFVNTEGWNFPTDAFKILSTEKEISLPNESFTKLYRYVMYIGVGVVGILSNGFVIIVIANTPEMKKRFSNWFVINQSVIDFFASVFLILDVTSFSLPRNFSGLADEIMCRFWSSGFLLWGSFICSTYNLVLITLERYLGVCHPVWHHTHFTRRVAFRSLVFPWLFGYANHLFNPITTGVENGACAHNLYSTAVAQKAVGIYVLMIEFIIPISLMVFSYISMALKTRNMVSTSATIKKKTEVNVLKTLIIVCSFFGLCQITNQIIFLFINFGYPLDIQSWYYHLSVSGITTNCCINPFIYAFKYDAFKKGMKNLFTQKVTPGSLSQATTETNTTGQP